MALPVSTAASVGLFTGLRGGFFGFFFIWVPSYPWNFLYSYELQCFLSEITEHPTLGKVLHKSLTPMPCYSRCGPWANSTDGMWNMLGSRISGFTQDLLSQSPHFNKIPRWCIGTALKTVWKPCSSRRKFTRDSFLSLSVSIIWKSGWEEEKGLSRGGKHCCIKGHCLWIPPASPLCLGPAPNH